MVDTPTYRKEDLVAKIDEAPVLLKKLPETIIRVEELWAQIRPALVSSNIKDLESLAHSMRGTVGWYGPDTLCVVLVQLMLYSRDGEVESAVDLLPVLEAATDQFLLVMRRFAEEQGLS